MDSSKMIIDTYIEFLRSRECYGDYGIEIPEELSARLDIGLPLARRICQAFFDAELRGRAKKVECDPTSIGS